MTVQGTNTNLGERPQQPDLEALAALAAMPSQAPNSVAMSRQQGTTINASRGLNNDGVDVWFDTIGNPSDDWDWIAVYRRDGVPDYGGLGEYTAWDWVGTNDKKGKKFIRVDGFSQDRYTVVYFKWKWGVAASAVV